MSGLSATSTALGGKANKNKSNNHPDESTNSNLDITKDEFDRISSALKNEEFRKLFFDYCAEIQDPENRALYEKEIIELEAERGVEVRFINPEPGFVIKTSADGQRKCFVNVAHSKEVAPPSSERGADLNGVHWSIPLAQSAGRGRDDVDARGQLCHVYDVIFHPEALQLAHQNAPFRKCLIDTALDAVEKRYKVQLDHANLKFPKMQFKGIARPIIIRKNAENPSKECSEPHPLEHIFPARPKDDADKIPEAEEPTPKVVSTTEDGGVIYATPVYVIKYRRDVDLSEYTYEVDAKFDTTVPHEIVVQITLPLLSSASECTLDVTEKQLYLFSDRPGARYRLQIPLPYAVNEAAGHARFDIDCRRLDVTLPVKKLNSNEQREIWNSLMLQLPREDSGVESGGDGATREPDYQSSSDTSSVTTPSSSSSSSSSETASPTTEEAKLVTDLNPNDENHQSIESIDKNVKIEEEMFLKSDLSYRLPDKFNCNCLDDVMSVVLHVRNVQEESVILNRTNERIHLQFTSIGGGFFPIYYAFCLQLKQETFNQNELHFINATTDAWQNNIILNIQLSDCCETIETVWVGLDANDLQEYKVKGTLLKPVESVAPSAPPALPLSKTVKDSKPELEPDQEEKEDHLDDHENDEAEEEGSNVPISTTKTTSASKKRRQRRKNKRRSYSESACDDLKQQQRQQLKTNTEKEELKIASTSPAADKVSSCSENPNTQSIGTPRQMKQRSYSESRSDCGLGSSAGSVPPSFKGILKRFSRYDRTMRPSISDSCSSIDDYVSSNGGSQSYSCSADNSNAAGSSLLLRFAKSVGAMIPEEEFHQAGSGDEDDDEDDENGLSESCKKTVRFNEVIQKQLFRMDCSILGQRKKNQKRRDRKHRALQRRLSEGDSADYDEKPLTLNISKKMGNKAYVKVGGKNKHDNDEDNDDDDHEHDVDNDGEHQQTPALLRHTNKNNNNNSSDNKKNIEQKVAGANNKKLNQIGAKLQPSSKVLHNANEEGRRPRLESESSSDLDNQAGKQNVMMFEMDM